MPRAARIRTQRSDSSATSAHPPRPPRHQPRRRRPLRAWRPAAADDTTTGAGAGGGTGTIKWAWQLPTTWDPVTSSAGSDVQMLALAYDALTALDDNGNAVGWLAESWTYDDDGTDGHLHPARRA